jgi:hypothetical protein
MRLQRSEDWLQRLSDYMATCNFKRFEWGRHDCCLFVANCVFEMTGVDLAQGYRGRYKDKFGAYKLMHGNLITFIEKLFWAYGMPEIPFLEAKTGDVVMFDDLNGTTLGIKWGTHIMAPGEKDLMLVPTIGRAWRV